MRQRKKTRKVRAGDLFIGGNSPVSIQSMTSLPLDDVEGTVRQIERLKSAGADLVRVAVRDSGSIKFLEEVIGRVAVPLSADVHFNHRIAIAAIEAGISKVRINPGNIGDPSKVREVLKAARERGVPIRVGVNGGSIDKRKYGSVTPENLVESALENIRVLEDNDFFNIVVSIKSSDVQQTIDANVLFSGVRDYPLHIGLTEAGYGLDCAVRSSVALGHLLLAGIGDTVRVSMTGDPVDEIAVARKILESVGERTAPIRIISCPTCGRTDPAIDLLSIAKEVDDRVNGAFLDELIKTGRSLTVAVMGCEVNGPGEASHADAGIAGAGPGHMVLFARGKKVSRIATADAVDALIDELRAIMDRSGP